MIIADVGQALWEEIDYEPAARGGRNYGWRHREGAHNYDPSVKSRRVAGDVRRGDAVGKRPSQGPGSRAACRLNELPSPENGRQTA